MLWIQDLQIPWNQWLLVSITVHTSLTIFLTQRAFERDTSLGRIKQQVRYNLLISVVLVHLSRESSCNPNSVEILVHLSSGVGILVHLSCGVEILVHISCVVGILVHPWRWGLVPKMDASSHQSRATVGVCDLFANFALQWRISPVQGCIYNTFATHFWDERTRHWSRNTAIFLIYYVGETSKKYVANFTSRVIHSDHPSVICISTEI